MCFASKKSKSSGVCPVTLDGMPLPEVPVVCYRGALLDSRLKWNNQFHHVQPNVKFGAAKLDRANDGMTQKQRVVLYYDFIQPHMVRDTYYIDMWM